VEFKTGVHHATALSGLLLKARTSRCSVSYFLNRLTMLFGLRFACVGLMTLTTSVWAATPWPQPVVMEQAALAPPIHIDGRLDEPAWKQALVYERFTQYHPVNAEAPPGLRTQVQIVVDGDAVVFGFRAFDDQPEKMREALVRRDRVKRDQDFVAVWLDPTGRGQVAQFVRIGLGGSLADGVHRAQDDEEDFNPDFPVQAAVQRLPDGYSVELRWPMSSMRYAYSAQQPWRVMFGRSVPHAEAALLLSAPLTHDALNFIAELQVMQGMESVARSVRDRSFAALTLEWTGRRTTTERVDRLDRRSSGPWGAAMKWRPRADAVVDVVLNPDFAQLELDAPPTTGASRLVQELPEKRSYFLESADVLGLPLQGFYSRSVADPRWGLRGTWRGDHADATVLQLEDRAGGALTRGSPYATLMGEATRPSEVMLARGRWLGEAASGGLLMSSRDWGAGLSNRAWGLDGQWRFAQGEGSHQLRWLWMNSRTTAGLNDNGRLALEPVRSDQMAWMEWRHRSPDWNNSLTVQATGPGFVHDNGFLPQAGASSLRWEINRRLDGQALRERGVPVHEFELHLGIQETRTLRDQAQQQAADEVIERRLQPGFWFSAAHRSDLWLNYGFDHQRARRGGVLHPVPAWHMGFVTSPWPWLVMLNGELTLGRQLDAEADRVGRGGNVWFEAQTRWALPAQMSLESDHRWARAWVRSPSGGPGFVEASWRWLATLHLDHRQMMRLTLQRMISGRTEDLSAGLSRFHDERKHVSLVWQYRLQDHQSVALGWVREHSLRPWTTTAGRDGEWFVKWQKTLDR
jgi:hypothetical protein